MDNAPHFSSDFSLGGARELPQYQGAFFPASQNLTVHGGTFTSNMHFHRDPGESSTPFSDYRQIRRGDIDLRTEVVLDEASAEIRRLDRRTNVRRVYSARIDGVESDRAIVVYRGENAEQEWREYIERHSRAWHPTILQIFGLASFSGVHAIVAHDDLLPIPQFLDLRRPSPVIDVTLHVFWNTDYYAYVQYSQETNLDRGEQETLWVRLSTGRLCVELAPSEVLETSIFWIWQGFTDATLSGLSLDDTSAETRAMQTLSVETYHLICWNALGDRFVHSGISEVPLGSLVFDRLWRPRDTYLKPVASVASKFFDVKWFSYISYIDRRLLAVPGERMSTGWTRFKVPVTHVGQPGSIYATLSAYNHSKLWLPQANHIFQRLNITSRHDDYGFVEHVEFELRIQAPTITPYSGGYLFICPLEHFWTERGSLAWPQCPWFWSLDPSGVPRLKPETAHSLGFPVLTETTTVHGVRWNTSVYEGLRTFHAAKGFDPDSQDLAKHLGCPLMELAGDRETLHADVDELSGTVTDDDVEDGAISPEPVDTTRYRCWSW